MNNNMPFKIPSSIQNLSYNEEEEDEIFEEEMATKEDEERYEERARRHENEEAARRLHRRDSGLALDSDYYEDEVVRAPSTMTEGPEPENRRNFFERFPTPDFSKMLHKNFTPQDSLRRRGENYGGRDGYDNGYNQRQYGNQRYDQNGRGSILGSYHRYHGERGPTRNNNNYAPQNYYQDYPRHGGGRPNFYSTPRDQRQEDDNPHPSLNATDYCVPQRQNNFNRPPPIINNYNFINLPPNIGQYYGYPQAIDVSRQVNAAENTTTFTMTPHKHDFSVAPKKKKLPKKVKQEDLDDIQVLWEGKSSATTQPKRVGTKRKSDTSASSGTVPQSLSSSSSGSSGSISLESDLGSNATLTASTKPSRVEQFVASVAVPTKQRRYASAVGITALYEQLLRDRPVAETPVPQMKGLSISDEQNTVSIKKQINEATACLNLLSTESNKTQQAVANLSNPFLQQDTYEIDDSIPLDRQPAFLYPELYQKQKEMDALFAIKKDATPKEEAIPSMEAPVAITSPKSEADSVLNTPAAVRHSQELVSGPMEVAPASAQVIPSPQEAVHSIRSKDDKDYDPLLDDVDEADMEAALSASIIDDDFAADELLLNEDEKDEIAVMNGINTLKIQPKS